jgi:flagellar biosynthesis anti-sigma factor FlgM
LESVDTLITGESPRSKVFDDALLDMKVNDTNLSSLGSSAASGTQQTGRTGQTAGSSNPSAASGAASGDDIHLSELVRSLRSLAADSPERQARIEQIARSYASGTYHVDPQATASAMVDDALHHS